MKKNKYDARHYVFVLVRRNQKHWTGDVVRHQFYNDSPTCAPVKHISQATTFGCYKAVVEHQKMHPAAKNYEIATVAEIEFEQSKEEAK